MERASAFTSEVAADNDASAAGAAFNGGPDGPPSELTRGPSATGPRAGDSAGRCVAASGAAAGVGVLTPAAAAD
ncbi:hypothetical protein [Mycobacteroides abscessus]|uniref:hypothetical protein n=1 Tax=Mycobacteroides abscessus TaxID=36809 RepID=UPI0013014ED0|nr:hypothetical protein [Mycobacteroides abscessus]